MADYRSRKQLRAQGEWVRKGVDLRTGEIVSLRDDPKATPLWKAQGSTRPDRRFLRINDRVTFVKED